jgi:hypothetical protein
MEKPWDRLVSQGAAVDWFAFWLKAEEGAEPGKPSVTGDGGALQSLRRTLRILQKRQPSRK